MNKIRYHFAVEDGAGAEDFDQKYFVKQTLDSGINESGVLHWAVAEDGNAFTDLSETYMQVELRVVRGDGSNLQPNDRVFLNPGSLQSLFSTCTVSLNGTALPSDTNYSQTTTLLSFLGSSSGSRRNVWGPLSGWGCPLLRSAQIPNPTPPIYDQQMAQVAGSKPVTLYGRLTSDFCMSCTQFLPPGMKLDIVLNRQPSAFSLSSGDDVEYRVEMTSATIFVKRLLLRDSIRKNALETIACGGSFSYNRLSTSLMPVAEDSMGFRWNNVYHSGQLPQTLYVVLLDQKAYYGDITSLSNYFESGGLKTMRFWLNGQSLHAEPYDCNFVYEQGGGVDIGQSSALTAFLGLVTVMGVVTKMDHPLGISYTNFLAGCTIFAAQVTGDARNQSDSGSLDLELEFSTPTRRPYLVFCFGEFPGSIVHFDKKLNIS